MIDTLLKKRGSTTPLYMLLQDPIEIQLQLSKQPLFLSESLRIIQGFAIRNFQQIHSIG